MELSSPWNIYYRELEALFAEDPEVKVKFNAEGPKVSLFVDNNRKADALAQLLPTEKAFGNVTLKIEVVPSNEAPSKLDLVAEAFFGNPALAYVWDTETVFGHLNFAVFQKKVVQYFCDNMMDINGVKSTLYQDIAQDVFGEDFGVYFCTEVTDKNLAKPLGEWP